MNRLRNNISRIQVLWCGTTPAPEVLAEFVARNLVVKVLPNLDALLPQDLPVSCGIVLDLANRPRELLRFFESFAPLTTDHGWLHVLLANDTVGITRIRSLQPDFTKTVFRYSREPSNDRKDFVRLIPKSNHDAAELLARWEPGPGKGTVQIRGDFSPKDLIFFERAFSDCREISVKRLTGGRSGIVYCVHATLLDVQNGSRPLPFFAKTDQLYKIDQERRKYQEFVNSYVSFHLRPDLDEARCLRGARRGMLVGDFVEKSESLRAVAARGHAQSALYSLFENTLSGLRLQAYPIPATSPRLWDKVRDSFNPDRLIKRFPNRLAQVRGWGGAGDPRGLYTQLERVADMPVLVSPMHGDLHANNVRVRVSDAILIDFNSMRAQMPLSIDPASMEISLAFRCGDEFEAVPAFDVWRSLIDRLYARDNLLRSPPPADMPNEREWLWAAVRQIRQIALSCQICPWEYGTVLAILLLRHSCFGNDFPSGHPRVATDEQRRAYAYLLGERIIGQLSQYAEAQGQ